MAWDIETERLKIIENDPAHIDHVMALMSFWEVAKTRAHGFIHQIVIRWLSACKS